MNRVIAMANHKGGVGKTTSVVNIGSGLAQLEKRVCIIDMDPQSHATQSLGITEPGRTIYGVLRGEYKPQPVQISNHLDLIPATIDLAGAEIELVGETGREYILKEAIKSIIRNYDFIFIDCPPSLGLLTINALTAAKEIFIPVQAEFFALDGLSKLLDVIKKLKLRINKSLKITGVFVTRYDERKVLNRNVKDTINNHFKHAAFESLIRENIALAEAPSQGKDIFSYDPKCKGADDYLDLCKEILQRSN